MMSFVSYFWSPILIDRERYPSEMNAFKQAVIGNNPVTKRQKYFRVLLESENSIANPQLLVLL